MVSPPSHTIQFYRHTHVDMVLLIYRASQRWVPGNKLVGAAFHLHFLKSPPRPELSFLISTPCEEAERSVATHSQSGGVQNTPDSFVQLPLARAVQTKEQFFIG